MSESEDVAVCSQCGREIPAEEALSVTFAKVKFCSGDCRERWTTNTNRRLR